ncbi:ribonuclease R [Sneathiella limimaris]|uniref:ribonuclease R n=1 Tax=Sneathiella limimaris TaxID=1964213 RepID=UPI00146DAA90
MTNRTKWQAHLPTKDQVREFITSSTGPVGKREIAKAFGIKGADRIYLKQMLKELLEEGVLEKGHRRSINPAGTLPPVLIIEITRIDDQGEAIAKPVKWDEDTPPPVIFVNNKTGNRKGPAPGVGDRLLARTHRQPNGHYEAKIIRHLKAAEGPILGIFTRTGNNGRVQPTDRKNKKEIVILDEYSKGAQSGEVVICELLPGRQFGLPEGKITERLGPMGDAQSISMIAIHTHGIPYEFSETVKKEALKAKPVTLGKRTDLRDVPILTIDPADARDRDDAVWAAPDDDPENPGGWQAIVAIADVAYYVRAGSALDTSALERGNSVYFPDRVVPMLPHELSSDLCSLHEGVDRPVMAVQMWFDKNGKKLRHKFMRALINSVASLTYRQAQDSHEGHPDEQTEPLKPILDSLFEAYKALKKARDKREPLDLELPERKIELNEDGFIKAVTKKTRFTAHMLIEEFMIQANVCAAETLIKKKRPCMFRVHEPPDQDKLEGLKETLSDMDINFAKGQVMKTATFNRILSQAKTETDRELVSALVLRSQSQAVYSPDNRHHFGLNLKNYAHFTSPIRRYADLLVHRSLISAHGFGNDGLSDEVADNFDAIGEQISNLERRAMLAERQTLDRFTAVYHANQVDKIFEAKVTGVTRAGLFVSLEPTGADALAPISTLGHDFFIYDQDRHKLIGERTGVVFQLADKIMVRLREVDIPTGSMVVSVEEEDGSSAFDAKARGKSRRALSKGRKPGTAPTGKPRKKRTTPKGKKRAQQRKSHQS